MVMFTTVAVYAWLAVIVFFGIVEAISVGLTSVWFCAGGLLAMLAAALGAPVWAQILVFVVGSGVLLALTRPLVRKFSRSRLEKTNADANVGKTGIVLEPIDNDAPSGTVQVGGKIWTARSETGEIIPQDEKVTIVRIEGVKLIVARK